MAKWPKRLPNGATATGVSFLETLPPLDSSRHLGGARAPPHLVIADTEHTRPPRPPAPAPPKLWRALHRGVRPTGLGLDAPAPRRADDTESARSRERGVVSGKRSLCVCHPVHKGPCSPPVCRSTIRSHELCKTSFGRAVVCVCVLAVRKGGSEAAKGHAPRRSASCRVCVCVRVQRWRGGGPADAMRRCRGCGRATARSCVSNSHGGFADVHGVAWSNPMFASATSRRIADEPPFRHMIARKRRAEDAHNVSSSLVRFARHAFHEFRSNGFVSICTLPRIAATTAGARTHAQFSSE